MHSYAQEVPIIHTCPRTSLLCGSVNTFDNLQLSGLPGSGAMSIWQHVEETRTFKLMHKRQVNHMPAWMATTALPVPSTELIGYESTQSLDEVMIPERIIYRY